MPTFAQVKTILDGLVAGRDLVRMRNKHGGNIFNWETACALRNALARFPGEEYRLIAPEFVGNGRANETYLIRVLSGSLSEEDIPRMPLGGPIFATAKQIQVIRQWIDEGALDDPPEVAQANCEF